MFFKCISYILEYKPNRPSFLPNPGVQISQIVPPGPPLPDGSNILPSFLQTTSTSRPTFENRVQAVEKTTVISLGMKISSKSLKDFEKHSKKFSKTHTLKIRYLSYYKKIAVYFFIPSQ